MDAKFQSYKEFLVALYTHSVGCLSGRDSVRHGQTHDTIVHGRSK